MTLKERRQGEIWDRWYRDFKIAKLVKDDKKEGEYKLARKLLDFALINDTLSMSQSTLLYKLGTK